MLPVGQGAPLWEWSVAVKEQAQMFPKEYVDSPIGKEVNAVYPGVGEFSPVIPIGVGPVGELRHLGGEMGDVQRFWQWTG